MTTQSNQCRICVNDKATCRCVGCSQDFCLTHLIEHRQELSKQLDQIEQERVLFQRNLLSEQVDQWEKESIEKIKQTAQEIRQLLSAHMNENIVRTKLDELTQQIKNTREQDNIIESDLQKWREELQQITQQWKKLSNIVIQQTETTLVKKIQVQFSGKYTYSALT